MKQLTCEMCGSTDLLKQDGVFVCQSCGMKYSVEEAKKMMIEGTVDVQGTVKVDDSSKIDNFYTMAENAYDAGNKQEAENYCNKIIEIDSTNYKAWLLKGKAAGWQSTLRRIRVEESVNCFTKAIENAPEDEVEVIKQDAATEFSSLSIALMRLCCDSFEEYPSEENAKDILKNLKNLTINYVLLSTKCDVKSTEFYKKVAKMMDSAVLNAWNNEIMKEFNQYEHRSNHTWERFTTRAFACISIMLQAISLPDDDKQADIERYKNLINMTAEIAYSHSDRYSSQLSTYVTDRQFTNEAKQSMIDNIMTYHQKIKEIDPSYVIPDRPGSKGCYVATAVYGSYDCPQVWTLRRYRDYTLAKTWYGRTFIRTYYAISPTLVKWFGNTEWFKKMWQGKLDRMVTNLQKQGVESTPYEDREW